MRITTDPESVLGEQMRYALRECGGRGVYFEHDSHVIVVGSSLQKPRTGSPSDKPSEEAVHRLIARFEDYPSLADLREPMIAMHRVLMASAKQRHAHAATGYQREVAALRNKAAQQRQRSQTEWEAEQRRVADHARAAQSQAAITKRINALVEHTLATQASSSAATQEVTYGQQLIPFATA
jgi:hypothetical protein